MGATHVVIHEATAADVQIPQQIAAYGPHVIEPPVQYVMAHVVHAAHNNGPAETSPTKHNMDNIPMSCLIMTCCRLVYN